MEYSEYKERLLLALNEPDISIKISEMMERSLESYRKEESERLKNELEECKSQLNTLILKNRKLKQMIQKLETETEAKQQEIQKEYTLWKEFQQVYDSMNQMYQMYQQLSLSGKSTLEGIFKRPEPDAWLAAGTQAENISTLWEYTKMQIMERRYGDVEKLSVLIYYFIDLYNKTKNEPIFKMQGVLEGDAFDVENHIRTSGSKAAGKINKVILYGYYNTKTNTILKKSVVEI